jgi:hypothetical protein
MRIKEPGVHLICVVPQAYFILEGAVGCLTFPPNLGCGVGLALESIKRGTVTIPIICSRGLAVLEKFSHEGSLPACAGLKLALGTCAAIRFPVSTLRALQEPILARGSCDYRSSEDGQDGEENDIGG